jgi:tRNA pseudouridine55 synthase
MLRQHVGAPKSIKIGHGGTLDPFADGLLPIGVGKGTKQLQRLLEGPKAYRFTLVWGTQTDTGDLKGQGVATSAVRPPREAVENILATLTGEIEQIPPAFSALKVNGARAYKLARAGEKVELAPRKVFIRRLEMLEYGTEQVVFLAEVSKGTYIRTLGEDIAKALGTVGHLTTLTRVMHGPFTLDQSIAPEMLDTAIVSGHTTDHLFPLLAEPLAR